VVVQAVAVGVGDLDDWVFWAAPLQDFGEFIELGCFGDVSGAEVHHFV
jgi:hypothetical protein